MSSSEHEGDELQKKLQLIQEQAGQIDTINKDIIEKMNRIGAVRLEINDCLLNIQLVRDECQILSALIKSVQTAPPLLAPSPKSGRSSRSSSKQDADDQILPKHVIKLDGKVKELHAIITEIQTASAEMQTWEEKLQLLLTDECEIQAKMLAASNEIREYKLFTEQSQKEIAFLRGQIKERKRELHQMQTLKDDAGRALDVLTEREAGYQDDGEKAELAKSIGSRQDELVKLESEIAVVRRRIFEFRAYSQEQVQQFQSEIQINEESANWQEEKQNLQQTLNDLKRELRSLRGQAQQQKSSLRRSPGSNSKNESLSLDDQTRFGSLIRKWGMNPVEEGVKGDLEEIWEQIQNPRLELAKLIEENMRKAKKLSNAKKQLERTVERFHSREYKHITESREKQEKFWEDERKLIQKIKSFKIKLAQLRWNNRV